MTRRRWLLAGVAWIAFVAIYLVIADSTVKPARADLPQTLYVDSGFGHDPAPGAKADPKAGSTPALAFKSLDAAVPHVRPGGSILLMGYGPGTTYQRGGKPCLTVRGEPGRPVTITRNVYTNRLRQPVITTRTTVTSRFVEVGVGEWTTPWPRDPGLSDGHGEAFVILGQIGLTGWDHQPPQMTDRAAWWSEGRLHLRLLEGIDPNRYPVRVTNGPGLCFTGTSRHVLVKNLDVLGVLRPVEVRRGAVDIRFENFVVRSAVRPSIGLTR